MKLRQITQSEWYRDSEQYARMSGQNLPLNALISLTMILALIALAIIVNV